MSAKTSTQPGRRTPLSLSGTVTKNNPSKGGSNAANGGGNNANGHTASNTNKPDNKLQLQKNEIPIVNISDNKETPTKRQQLQADKKQQNDNKKSNEKNQNGVSSIKQPQSNENKQQQFKDKQLNKDRQQQRNGNDDNKTTNEKDKKEKPDKADKQEDKSEKEDTKLKEDRKREQDKLDNKKEEKKSEDVKEAKDDKKEGAIETDANTKQQQLIKNDDIRTKEENRGKNCDQKHEEQIEKMEVVEDEEPQQKSAPGTPKSNVKNIKVSTPVNKTPTKFSENSSQKSTPTNKVKITSIKKREETTTIDDNDVEMESLAIESSPIKSSQPVELATINVAPSATSTPGKTLLLKRNSAVPKSDVQLATQTGLSPERPRSLYQISGRKSIRPISDYTPSKFQSNLQFRESYRRINTELDVTNTSMNVTVGSEVANNFSFSFFGRGRKRDRTPPQHSQSAIGELQTDVEISPPKRARLDAHGFLSVFSSPLSLLRNRFSKASLQSSTPVKLELNTDEDEIEVQNVSGVSVHEEVSKSDKEPAESNTTVQDDNDATIGEEAKENKSNTDIVIPTSDGDNSDGKESKDVSTKCEKICGVEQTCEESDIMITETPLQPAVGDPMAKNKRCIIM